jgi:hypothetical protein
MLMSYERRSTNHTNARCSERSRDAVRDAEVNLSAIVEQHQNGEERHKETETNNLCVIQSMVQSLRLAIEVPIPPMPLDQSDFRILCYLLYCLVARGVVSLVGCRRHTLVATVASPSFATIAES